MARVVSDYLKKNQLLFLAQSYFFAGKNEYVCKIVELEDKSKAAEVGKYMTSE